MSMTKFYHIAVLVLVAPFFFIWPHSANADTIPLAVDMDFSPFEIHPPENGLRGFDVEVVDAAFKRAGVTAEMNFLPFARVLSMTKRGKFAGLFTCSFRADRQKDFLYSDKISQASRGFLMRREFEGHEPKVINDARGLRTGGLLANSTLKDIRKVNPDTTSFRTLKLALIHLLENNYDYLFGVKEVLAYQAKKMGVSDQLKFSKIGSIDFFICFSKKWPGVQDVVNTFNEGLAAIRADGTYDKIHAKYR